MRVVMRLVMVIFISCYFQDPATPDEWQDRFSKEAPLAWKRGEEIFMSSASGTLESRPRPGGLSMKATTDRICFSKAMRVVEFEDFDPLRKVFSAKVAGANSNYAFTLIRRDIDRPWTIGRVFQAVTPEVLEAIELDIESKVLCRFSPFATMFCSLRRLVSHPGFELKSAMERDGIVEIQFNFRGELNVPDSTAFVPGLQQLGSGTLKLDPNNYWIPVGYKLVLGRNEADSVVFSRKYEYPVPTNGDTRELRLPKSIFFEANYTEQEKIVEIPSVVQIEIECNWDLAGESFEYPRFTLTAYGLSEPHWAPQLPSSWRWLVFCSMTGITVVGIVLIMRLKKKRAK
jgi:hypothetical protein